MKLPRHLLVFALTLVLGITISSNRALAVTPAPPQSKMASATAHASSTDAASAVVIPGPLRSFLRMAGISQKAAPEEVLPLLADMVKNKGYVGGRPTEFLVLVKRYL